MIACWFDNRTVSDAASKRGVFSLGMLLFRGLRGRSLEAGQTRVLYWRNIAADLPGGGLKIVVERVMVDSDDRRASERIPVTAGTSCTFAGKVEDVGPVKIRDVSLQGIGLVLMKTIQVGSILALSLSNSSKGFAKTMMVKIAHVTPIPGGFLAGGSFSEPLTYQEFTSLVM